MLNPNSTTAPLLAIAQHSAIPYEDVLVVADMYRYTEFNDTHLLSTENYHRAETIAATMRSATLAKIYDVVCDHKGAQGIFRNHG